MRFGVTIGILSLAATAASCTASPDGAHSAVEEPDEQTGSIIGGTGDTGDPSVVAVYGQSADGSGGFLCTGTVIAPTVVLTAAHCVSPMEVPTGTKFTVITGSDIDKNSARSLEVAAVHANPSWKSNRLEDGHDEGIVILKSPTTLHPQPINREALGDIALGRPLRLVGFGLNDGAQQTGAGTKRQVLTSLRSFIGNVIRVGDSHQGTCNGDSGGPAFMNIGGVETIVGTTSYGNETCTDGGYDARIDTDVKFIDQYLGGGTCTPVCAGRTCGIDGCGGVCGQCGADQACSSGSMCETSAGGCAVDDSEQEPNDTALLASPLCPGGTAHGRIDSSADADWFSWTVPADSVYTVTLAAKTSGATLRVYKISAAGKLSFIADGPTVTKHTDAGGSYVGRILASGTEGTDYDLTVQSTP